MITIHKEAQELKTNLFEANEILIKISKTGKTATVYDYETQTKQKKQIFQDEKQQKFIKYKGYNATEYIFLKPKQNEIIVLEY